MPNFQIAGQRVTLAPSDVIHRLQDVEPEEIEVHAVEVDGRLFPVVQALEVVTGIPRRETRSIRGREVLGALGFRLIEVRSNQPTTLFSIARRHWVFQCNPQIWDVFGWWDDQNSELGEWTVYRYLGNIRPGDDAIFWVAGREAGVYGVGTVASVPYLSPPPKPTETGYWLKPPTKEYWACQLNMIRYFFDGPLRKATLAADPDFADALVLRIPGGGTPQPLTDGQWTALERHLQTNLNPIVGVDPTRPVVSERLLGTISEPTIITTPAEERTRVYREAKLVKEYELHLGRQLVVRSVKLPGGDRLVTDAYDPTTGVLIEAKASSTRKDVRMALGQLLDYSRFFTPPPRLAVLLPDRPTSELVGLMDAYRVSVIVRTASGFVEVAP